MRLSRANAVQLEGMSSATDLIASGDLDLLQLDFGVSPPGRFADRFPAELRSIHKHFFLEPKLRLITNAGGGNVRACVEALGGYLREHGDEHMPITAIRGDNILPRLSELRIQGIAFADELTGEPLLVDSRTVQSAQVQLGAGPLAAAFAEESRMVVAGCYDPTAPYLAAGVALADLEWDDYDALAQLAVASEISAEVSVVTEMTDPEGVTIRRHPFANQEWNQEIERLSGSSSELACADVTCEVSSLRVEPLDHYVSRLTGVTGSAATEHWRVRLVLQDDAGQPTEHWSSIPRNAIPLSVDTRPAAEWL